MNPSPSNDWESRWHNRLAQARRAAPPPVDVALAVRAALTAFDANVATSWIHDFALALGHGRVFAACGVSAVACVAFAGWQAWSALDAIDPWARWLLLSAIEGGLS